MCVYASLFILSSISLSCFFFHIAYPLYRRRLDIIENTIDRIGGFSPFDSRNSNCSLKCSIRIARPSVHIAGIFSWNAEESWHRQTMITFTLFLFYSFRECGLEFSNREALTLHLRLHSGDRTLVTDLCGLAAAFQQTPGHFLTPNTPTTHQVITICARGVE